ncbi:aminopeptidase [Candidatus Poribacteria bacterium]|nr:aminopeptidase [Candidatus Poribacteria bacterium]
MTSPIEPRDRELARLIISHSVKAKGGDLVYIQCIGTDTLGLGHALVEETTRAGAAPYLQYTDQEMVRSYVMAANEASMKRLAEFETVQMKNATCYIGVRGTPNIFEHADIPRAQMDMYRTIIYKPVHLDIRVNETRWCVLRYPNASMAQLAQQSRPAFADFYYRVCLVDYAHMAEAVKPLKALMERTDKVHIKGQGTDLQFSIKGIPAIPCSGSHNIPDGECFTAPVRESINGVVQFNTPTVEDGVPYENIRLRFEKGRVVEASGANAAQTKRLNEVFDQDGGARYVGEFALGFNPGVMEPMRDILFDEKICGSFHMAMGQCYEDAQNGNNSAIHWDLVCIQRPDSGGGEIWFDGKLIRKDGVFVVDELQGLNPDAFAAKQK